MSYWYLATPYTLYPLGREEAFKMACRVTADLFRAGVPVFSPIAHSHPIAMHGGIDPTDHETWMRADRPMMAAAHGLIVFKAAGWAQSKGVQVEIETFRRAGKPVLFMAPARPLVIPREILIWHRCPPPPCG
jgi:hypothetical protein